MNGTGRRRGAPIPLLAAIAVAPAILLTGVWQYADSNIPPPTTTTTTTEPPPPVDELDTPLASYRRHPMPLAEKAANDESSAVFDEWVSSMTATVGPGSCVQVVDADADLVVADVEPTAPLIPASNMKLLPAAVALEVLGADHRFRTELQSVRPVEGVIAGDVYLVGGGDPVLRTADVDDPLRYPAFNTTALEPLADQLVTLGITRIEGDIVGDGSRYDDEFRAPSWGDDITSRDAGPYDALLVNDGQIGNGNYGLEPNRAAARIFFDLLTARGIAVTGAAANATRPAGVDLTTLALIESEPLEDILVELLHTSDNNTAEMLVKEIGFVGRGEGSRQAGLDQIRLTLGGWGIQLDGVELHDGSGLSRDNRLTCQVLTAILTDTPVAEALIDLLPVAGRDGTMTEQLLDTPAEGRLQAKTGTLTSVKALTGAQPGADRRPVVFSVVLNGDDVSLPGTYQPVWTTVVQLIAEYPTVIEPDVDEFAPR